MPVAQDPSMEEYLDFIFPWDPQGETLYKSVTWTFYMEGQKKFANYAAQTKIDLVRLIETRARLPQADIYVAMGTQRMALAAQKVSRDGFPKANRVQQNMVSYNQIVLDIDVGKPPKPDGTPTSYKDTAEAVQALINLCQNNSLPQPTLVVNSGSGGIHVYWCTETPMTAEQWGKLAGGLQAAAIHDGLLFDPQVTVNPTLILRVPGTLNWKRDPVGHVQTMGGSKQRYDYMALYNALSTYVGSLSGVRQHPHHPINVSSRHSNFTDGVGQAAPIALADVAANCPTIADSLARAGDGDAEPLWNLMIYAATFTDDSEASAHALSSGDPRYTHMETEQKRSEKIMARGQGLGWPSCAQFSALSPHCKTCPLLVLNKSPFNHARRPVIQQIQTAQLAIGAVPNPDDLVPAPYWMDTNGEVYYNHTDKEGNTEAINLFERPILEAGINPQDGSLCFKTKISGTEFWASIPAGAHSQAGAMVKSFASIGRAGFNIPTHKYSFVRDFLVAWTTHLQKTHKQVHPVSYGWLPDMSGFTFADTTYLPNQKQTAFIGRAFSDMYKVVGDDQPFRAAMGLIHGNPALEVIVASSFAAPLTALIGTTSAVLSVVSPDSGVGKSTAIKIAQSVWGHPTKGIASLDDTNNAVREKIANLQSLPVYWDELTTAEATAEAVKMVFSFTQGKSKARMRRDATLADVNSFVTLFCTASNYSLSSTIFAGTGGTEAGGLRVFEFLVPPLTTTKVDNHTAMGLIQPLTNNYGSVGAQYSEFIVNNKDAIKKILDKVGTDLHKLHHFEAKERFWEVTMKVLITGAYIANAMKLTNFNIGAMNTFLSLELAKQRENLGHQGHTTLNDVAAAEEVLNRIMAEIRGKQMIITQFVPPAVGGGRPVKQNLISPDMMNISRLDNVWMQVGQLDGRIRFRVVDFNHHVRKMKLNPDQIITMLRRDYLIVQERMQIGAGVAAVELPGRSQCYDLTPFISPGSTHDLP